MSMIAAYAQRAGDAGLALVSRRGDLLLELEVLEGASAGEAGGSGDGAAALRDAWLAALADLVQVREARQM
jgi:hypothetical protein